MLPILSLKLAKIPTAKKLLWESGVVYKIRFLLDDLLISFETIENKQPIDPGLRLVLTCTHAGTRTEVPELANSRVNYGEMFADRFLLGRGYFYYF